MIGFGAGEAATGGDVLGGAKVVTAGSGGILIEVTGAALVGGILAIHGASIVSKAAENLANGNELIKESEGGSNSSSTPQKKTSDQLRKEWEKGSGEKWPKETDNPSKNQHAHHKTPVADRGEDGYPNIEPKPAQEHSELHKRNGDFKRWGYRRSR